MEDDSEYANFMSRSRDKYEDALRSLPNLEPPSEFQYCPALQAELKVYLILGHQLFVYISKLIMFVYIFQLLISAWNITRRVGFLDSQIPISWEASVFVAQITAWYFLQRSVDSLFCPTLLQASTI